MHNVHALVLSLCCVCTFDRLDRGVGRDLHVCEHGRQTQIRQIVATRKCESGVQTLTGRAEERGARVATRDGHDSRVHQVLNEGARDDDFERVPRALRDTCDVLLDLRRVGERSHPVASGCSVTFVGGHARRDGRRRLGTLHRSPECVTRRPGEGGLQSSGLGCAERGERERLLERNVDVLVHLLVVDDDVHVVARELGSRVKHLGRGHAVELADLGGALEHLDAVGVCVHRNTEQHG